MALDSNDFRIFAGTVQHTLDEKNRVTIPARWRDEQIGEFYAVADPRKPVLLLMLEEELRRMGREIEQLEDLSVAQRRSFTRQLFAGAFACPIDKNGRVVLPPELCTRMGFVDEVILAGTGTRIEVVDPGSWEETCENEKDAFIQGAHSLGL